MLRARLSGDDAERLAIDRHSLEGRAFSLFLAPRTAEEALEQGREEGRLHRGLRPSEEGEARYFDAVGATDARDLHGALLELPLRHRLLREIVDLVIDGEHLPGPVHPDRPDPAVCELVGVRPREVAMPHEDRDLVLHLIEPRRESVELILRHRSLRVLPRLEDEELVHAISFTSRSFPESRAPFVTPSSLSF